MKPSRRSFLAAILCAPALRWMRFELEEQLAQPAPARVWKDDRTGNVYRYVLHDEDLWAGRLAWHDDAPIGVAVSYTPKGKYGWVITQGRCNVITD